MRHLFLRLLKKTGLIVFFNLTVKSTVNNKQVFVPLKGLMGYENVFLLESWFSDISKHILTDFTERSIFVDVGVNIGQTILKIKTINPEVNYIGFEPNAACVYYAHELVKINHFSNISIFPVGLGSESGLLKLYADNVYASGASVIKGFRRSGKKIQFEYNINVLKGDEVLKNIDGLIRLIKIDVEGFEADVIQGLTEVIFSHRPVIICEVLPVYTENNTARLSRQQKLESLLRENDYKIFQINEMNSTISPIAEIGIHGDMGRTNYLFCHSTESEKLASVLS